MGFQTGVRESREVLKHFERVASMHITVLHLTVLHLLYTRSRWGSSGYGELLQWVAVQKRLKTTALVQSLFSLVFQKADTILV